MRVSKLCLLGGGAAAFAAAALAWAQQQLQPGSYEFTIEMAIPGSPTPVAMTETQCLTADEARDLRSIMQEQMATDGGCEYSEPVTRGDTMSWETTCDDLTAKSEITITANGFSGTTITTLDGADLVAKFAAKRIGACAATAE
jgi:hypothetical protein